VKSKSSRKRLTRTSSEQLDLKFKLLVPKKKKILVLDLDETLIHSSTQGSRYHDHVIEVMVDKHICLYYVYKRPFVDHFLKKVSEWYKIVIFTASLAEYADPVIDYLDSKNCVISKRFFRDSCIPMNGSYAKNLSLVDEDLSSLILVDNSPVAYQHYPENGIPIQTWVDDQNDEALLDLLLFLDALRYTQDVRSVLRLKCH
jgi:CTD nuclear envelope phosphatase 1